MAERRGTDGHRPLATDTVGLLEGITSTRSIRRYRDEPVPEDVLRDILFAATRAPSGSNRQARMARTMRHYVDEFEQAPVVVLPCYLRYRPPRPADGASVYPACQNLLLAARALGYGGVITNFNEGVADELHQVLGMPGEVWIAATITLGRPQGSHGSTRRRPLPELVFEDTWGAPAPWAVDPPGTRYTSAGPPR